VNLRGGMDAGDGDEDAKVKVGALVDESPAATSKMAHSRAETPTSPKIRIKQLVLRKGQEEKKRKKKKNV
jgi:hypothetical protein